MPRFGSIKRKELIGYLRKASFEGPYYEPPPTDIGLMGEVAVYRSAIIRAIRERRIVEFDYDGHRRVAEPHTLGVVHGDLQLLAYQIAGSSRSGKLPEWRRFHVNRISDLLLTDTRFSGIRPSPSGHHAHWDYKIAFIPSE